MAPSRTIKNDPPVGHGAGLEAPFAEGRDFAFRDPAGPVVALRRPVVDIAPAVGRAVGLKAYPGPKRAVGVVGDVNGSGGGAAGPGFAARRGDNSRVVGLQGPAGLARAVGFDNFARASVGAVAPQQPGQPDAVRVDAGDFNETAVVAVALELAPDGAPARLVIVALAQPSVPVLPIGRAPPPGHRNSRS